MSVQLRSAGAVRRVFERCRAQGHAAFIPFLVAGDPDLSASIRLVETAAESGADIIEIGIPYSDPIADGPTIQRASQRALGAGMTFDRALEMVSRLRCLPLDVPLIGFTYYNPVLVRGIEKTARDFASCGFAGIIVPDLPAAEAEPLLSAFSKQGLAVTFLVAPTTPPERVAAIASQCTDFVYVVSRMGVTGAERRLGEQARHHVERVSSLTSKPIAIGFGVTSPLDVAAVASAADGVIVGSALIDRIAAHESTGGAVESLRSFCNELAFSCRRA